MRNVTNTKVFFLVLMLYCYTPLRNLFQQNRVKIHIHLLFALGLCSLATVLWYALVHRDLFLSDNMNETVITQNPVSPFA